LVIRFAVIIRFAAIGYPFLFLRFIGQTLTIIKETENYYTPNNYHRPQGERPITAQQTINNQEENNNFLILSYTFL